MPVSARKRFLIIVLGVNMVFFDRIMPGDYADYVGLDNADAMAKLFAYAVAQHRLVDPVFVTHSDLKADSDKLREQAFLKNCAARGLSGRIVALPQKAPIKPMPAWFSRDSAVFCVNDAMALRLRPYLKKQLLLGIDGLTATIPSCVQPMEKMAQTAVRMLLAQQKKGTHWRARRELHKGDLINV